MVVEWDRQKGYGFLQVGTERVFLHRAEFAMLHRTPVVGDRIEFCLGQDGQGRMCAKEAALVRGCLGIGWTGLLLLAGLLLLPIIAILEQSVDSRWIGACAFAMSAVTYWRYACDKRAARVGEWRVPENRLHLLELLGGWPGAFLAQRRLRHKCSKVSYQLVFWLIVLGYQFAAFDSLQNWRLSCATLNRLSRSAQHGR